MPTNNDNLGPEVVVGEDGSLTVTDPLAKGDYKMDPAYKTACLKSLGDASARLSELTAKVKGASEEQGASNPAEVMSAAKSVGGMLAKMGGVDPTEKADRQLGRVGLGRRRLQLMPAGT